MITLTKKPIHTDKAGRTVGPYSQAVEYNGLIFVSGVTAIDPLTGTPVGSVEEQAQKILSTIETILAAADSGLDKVLKTTIFLKDVKDFAKVNAVYAEHFKEPYPARITVAVADIPLGALVEIDAVAHK
jgi:2-iminobutanoate/2-iminopropanoate deaminase